MEVFAIDNSGKQAILDLNDALESCSDHCNGMWTSSTSFNQNRFIINSKAN